MPNTKEVEQSAADFLRKKIGPENFWRFPQGFSQSEIFEYMEDFKALSNPLEQSEKKEEWVSVETALPEDDLTVFVCNCEIANRIGVGWYFQRWYSTINEKVTHWMAVPKLPKPPKNLV